MKAIILTKGRIATVDDDDFDRVNQFKWSASRSRRGGVLYAVRNVWTPGQKSRSGKTLRLHTFVMGGAKGVDHINGDPLDNRKENLRVISVRDNNRAFRKKSVGKTSRFRGVSWYKENQTWTVRIHKNGKSKNLGCFRVEEDAARAYDKAAQEEFGGFAHLNFPA